MSNSALGIVIDQRDAQVDGTSLPVEPTSALIHATALEILEREGKAISYTADEYIAAVKKAELKTGLGSVHRAMTGRSTFVGVR
jgi:hypothetical protein